MCHYHCHHRCHHHSTTITTTTTTSMIIIRIVMMLQESFRLRRLDISGLDLTLVAPDSLARALTKLEQVRTMTTFHFSFFSFLSSIEHIASSQGKLYTSNTVYVQYIETILLDEIFTSRIHSKVQTRTLQMECFLKRFLLYKCKSYSGQPR